MQLCLQDRDLLKIHQRRAQLGKWKLRDGDYWVEIARQSGLLHLRGCMYNHINFPLISAFVERWEPETNCFNLPFGEMTVLLHDVYFLLGVQINGAAVVDEVQFDRQDELVRLAQYLRYPEENLVLHDVGRRGMKWASLKEHCEVGWLQQNNPHVVASGYLLFLLGSTLFADKSQDRIPLLHLRFLTEHARIPQMSWGSAGLAVLYRRLGQSTRVHCKQLAGCATLLEVTRTLN